MENILLHFTYGMGIRPNGYGRISGRVSGSSREPIFDEDSFGYYLKEI